MEEMLSRIMKSKILTFLLLPLVIALMVFSFLKSNNTSQAKEELDKAKSKSDELLREENSLKSLSDEAEKEAAQIGERINDIKENKPKLVEDVIDEDWHKNRK